MVNSNVTSVRYLQLFADGAGASGGEGATGSNSVTAGQGVTGAVNSPIAQGKTSFDDLLKDPDYKKAYDERVGKAIQNRFKSANAAEERMRAALPLFDKLATKYGVQAGEDGQYDLNALLEAADEDDSYYESEALEKGLSVEDLKKIKTLERENAEFRKREAEAKKTADDNARYQALMAGANETKAMYPSFDLDTEMKNETFARMVLVAKVPVRTAFEVVHRDQIMPAAMQFASQKTAQQTAQTIAAGRMRPMENGASGAVAANTNLDPAHLSSEQIRQIISDAKAGKKIRF